ncbi:unnamed protein product [Staurois parvus]|uniref:Uncharacterized protein n=1 Tax=Staurois parvus TaxID=386267 RepID=A0ABN9H7Z0_9NEOB|nr:unnamed protein product [Staurois parvus]
MQTASTNICERMGRSQELSEFKRGTVIGCHLCNKSIREISLLLNIPRKRLVVLSPSAMQSVICIGVKHATTLEQWRYVLWSDKSHFSVW